MSCLAGGELGIRGDASRRPPLRRLRHLARSAGKRPAFSQLRALSGFESRIRQQKARIPRDTGSAIRLAESWGFEPQIPLWGILA